MSRNLVRLFKVTLGVCVGGLCVLLLMKESNLMRSTALATIMDSSEVHGMAAGSRDEMDYGAVNKLTCTDLKQYQHYLGLSKHQTELTRKIPSVNFLRSYNITVSNGTRGHAEVMHFDITETFNGMLSKGGSSFRVEMFHTKSTALKSMCVVEDYFQGHYTVTCKMPPSCADVVFYWMYAAYSAYYDIHKFLPMAKKIAIRKICRPENKTMAITYCATDVFRHLSRPPVTEGWVKDPLTSHWLLWTGRCAIKPLDGATIKTCVERLHSLNFLGDSHMRYNYYDLLQVIGKLHRTIPWLLRENHATDNIYLYWCGYAENVTQQLNVLLGQNVTLTSRDIIIVNTGAWDMQRNTNFVLWKKMPSVVESIKQFKATAVGRDATLVWLTLTAQPYVKTSHATNPFIEAVNAWTKQEFRKIGVPVFDLYPATQVRIHDSACDVHFHCRNMEQNIMYGEVGLALFDMMFQYLCEAVGR